MWETVRQLRLLSYMDDQLPDYAARLDALHRALEDDFRKIVALAPLGADATVLDAGCGDGFFTGLLRERAPHGTAIALDNSSAYLDAARKRLAALIAAGRCRVVEGDVAALPFDAASLDSVWSFHSMQSYDDIPHVLGEFRRVLKPGALLAVVETDNVHSIMLSWPPGLELAVRRAEHQEIGDDDSYKGTYFPRFASRLIGEAGFVDFRREFVFVQRQPPVSEALEEYVQLYLENLHERVAEHLPREAAARLRGLAAPDSKEFLPRQESFFFGSLQTLITARAPPGE